MPFRVAFVLFISTTALLMDLKNSRISNSFIVFSILIGISANILESGIKGLLFSLEGMLLPFFLHFALFYFHMLGTGDIKLFCALGVLQGARQNLKCILFAWLLGAMMSMVIICYTGIAYQRMEYLHQYLRDYIRTGTRKPYLRNGMDHIENFHFTIPIMMSVLLYVGGLY